MMRKGLTRGGLLFATIWLGIFAVAYLVWAIYLGNINARLTEYESIQPKHEAERVFAEYFLNADISDMIGYEEGFCSAYDKKSAEKAISSLIEGKVLTYKAENRALYGVYADGEIVAWFTLKGSEERSPLLGARKPILDKIDWVIEPTVTYTVIAPKGAVIKLNGVTVTDEDMLKSGTAVVLDAAEYFTDEDSRTIMHYSVKLFAEPSVSVESADGELKYAIDLDKDTRTFSAEKSYLSHLKNIYYVSIH